MESQDCTALENTNNLTYDVPIYHKVTIDFPEDPIELAKVLSWLFNGNGFMIMSMEDDLIKKAKKAGIQIRIED